MPIVLLVLSTVAVLVLLTITGNVSRVATALEGDGVGGLEEGDSVLVRYGETEGLVRVKTVTPEGVVVLEGY